MWKSYRIIKKFKPDVVIGTGGFASGAILKVASMLGIPTLVQEQNSYPGITNKLLAKKTNAICVAYEGMEKFFPAQKIIITGNPVRAAIAHSKVTREEGLKFFGLNTDKKTVLVVGGSLGAKSINEAIDAGIDAFEKNDLQLIWQFGKTQLNKLSFRARLMGVFQQIQQQLL